MYRFAVFLCIVLLTACSSAKVINREKADYVDLSSYKTFDFYAAEDRNDTASQYFRGRVANVEDAIALKMQKLGYLLSKTNPDLLINIGLVTTEKVQTRQTDLRTDAPRYIGQRRYSWKSEEVETGRYQQGTATVHVVDTRQNKMVWKGALQGALPEKESGSENAIRKGINKLFADYPQAAAK